MAKRQKKVACFSDVIPQVRIPQIDRKMIERARRITKESISEFSRQANRSRADAIMRGAGLDPDEVRGKLSLQ